MSKSIKSVRLSEHAKTQLVARGTTEEEVIEAIQTCPWLPSELSRFECRKDFVFNNIWNGKSYRTKQVRPIFAEEAKEIVVVTVYVYYF